MNGLLDLGRLEDTRKKVDPADEYAMDDHV
jgi:hypothetical protein